MGAVWSAITGAVLDITGWLQVIASWLVTVLFQLLEWAASWFHYLFDPVKMLGRALLAVKYLLHGVAALLPADYATQISHWGDVVGGVPFQKGWVLGTFVIQNFCHVAVITAAMELLIAVWLAVLVIRVVVYVASLFWSSPS